MTEPVNTPPMRVRFPPSPTGYLHVGGARSALFNWLAARQSGGTFILRIEDTDQRRLNEDSVRAITDGLRWLGLQWDEGPEVGGPFAPYVQSERLPHYQHWARWLVDNGYAYEDFDPPPPPGAPPTPNFATPFRQYRDWTPAQRDEARQRSETPPAIRMKVPLDGETVFHDLVRGEIRWQNKEIPADPVLLKRDGYPTYHLAVVVDDHEMQVSHVMRADEWLPSAPIHAILYGMFGWQLPVFCHLPLVKRADGKKFSKRHGDSALHEYRERGFLPEALVNFLCLLGWSYGDDIEIFTKEQAAERFRIADIRPAPSIWDLEKLLWMNGQYINHVLTLDEFADRAVPFLHDAGLALDADREYLKAVLALEKERVKLLGDVPEMTRYFFAEPPMDDAVLALLRKEGKEQTEDLLDAAFEVIGGVNWADHTAFTDALDHVNQRFGTKKRVAFMLVRIAVSGRTATPDLGEMLTVLGRERVNRRLRAALDALRAVPAQ